MIFKNDTFEIPDDNPFCNDKLNREVIADNLEKIIETTTGSLVLSIDSCWGNGKTTFIQMWTKKLRKSNKYKTLYFNAWENDESNDPLLALLGEFEELLTNDKDKENIIKSIMQYGKPLLKRSIPTAIKMLTGGILSCDIFNIGDKAESNLVELAGKLGEIELKEYKKEKELKKEFKEALINYQSHEGKKIIFFIDELDRCRPTFAVETLERIKHLFNIDQYIFVLSLDKRQLSHSVEMLYGQKIDADGYLRRFFDLEFILPEPNRDTYTEYLLSTYQLTNSNKSTVFFERFLKSTIKSFDLSLRDIDKLFDYLKLILPSSHLMDKKSNYTRTYLQVLGAIYAFFPILKLKKNDEYQQFIRHEPISLDLINSIGRENDTTIYLTVMTKLITLNNQLKVKKKITANYIVGESNGIDQEYDLEYLLNENQEQFSFIEQLEFVNNFIVKV